jgi:putative flippase GtrA
MAHGLNAALAQIARFVIVGAINTIAGLLIIYGMMFFVGANLFLANFCGYAVGLLISFVLNKSWSFTSDHPIGSSLFRFLLVFCVAYLVNLVALKTATEAAGLNPYFAQMIAIVFYSVVFFIGCRVFAFPQAALSGRVAPDKIQS